MEFIKDIFNTSPKNIHYYTDRIIDQQNLNTFTLTCLLLYGAQKLFGNEITPNIISLEQFNILNKYMNSIGYDVQYTFLSTNIKILFSKIPLKKKTCNGNYIFI